MRKLISTLAALAITSTYAAADEAKVAEATDASSSEAVEKSIFADKEHLGIYWNKHVDDLNTKINESDKLVLTYIYHSKAVADENGQQWDILNLMFNKVLEELNYGYVTTYAIDCDTEHEAFDPEANVQALCEREEFSGQPVFTLYKPAEIKINPYTGKEMPVESIHFASNSVSDPDIKKWITDNVPDFTQRIMQKDDYDQYAAETDIKKVYLFSAKQKVPPIYKALSANFRNRLRFAFVNVEAVYAKTLADEFETTKWPTLLLANESGDGEGHLTYDGKMKLNELIAFLEPHALPVDQKKEERVISSKSQTTVNKRSDASGFMHFTKVSDIDEKILDDWKGALVYVTSKDKLDYVPVIEEMAKEMGNFVNIAMLVVDDVEASSADLKKEFKSTKLPQFRFYPNIKTGQDKRAESHEIMISKNADIEEAKATLTEELTSNYVTDVKDVSEKVYWSLSSANARDGKITILYMYDGQEQDGVEFAFKALSADPSLQEDFVFMGIDGPSAQLTNDSPLPAISGLLTIDDENPAPRVFHFSGMQKVYYQEVQMQLLKLFPGKWEAFEEEMRIKAFKKQNPGQDTSAGTRDVPRQFKEISGMQDFEDVCRAHKACGIAILPAITTIDYEADSFQQKFEILEQIDKAAGKAASPVHYAWLNATCHTEIFSFFDVEPTSLPTIVYFNAQHNKYGTMIGKFDKESIEEHEEKFKNGKLSLREAKVDKREMNFTDIDCKAQLLEEVNDADEDFDEILAEILAEEKARKQAEEGESGGSKKSKKKGKKGKKNKKGKGSFKSEEL